MKSAPVTLAILVLSVASVSTCAAAPDETGAVRVGDVSFKVPAGWKRQDDSSGDAEIVTTLVPDPAPQDGFIEIRVAAVPVVRASPQRYVSLKPSSALYVDAVAAKLRQPAKGSCCARYTVIEDPLQRATANKIFQRWMQESAETATGLSTCGADTPVRESATKKTEPNTAANIVDRENMSGTLAAWGPELQDRDTVQARVRPAILPSGFLKNN